MTKGRMTCLIAFGIVGVAFLCAVPWMIQVAQAVADAKKGGLLDEEKTEKYQVGRDNNLKAICTALKQAADSDGQFPPAAKWMESAMVRLKTSDINESEAQQKLMVPGRKDGFGYAYNGALAGKSPDDFKAKGKTVIVYESKQTKWDAFGDPAKDALPGGKGVTLDGDIVDFKR